MRCGGTLETGYIDSVKGWLLANSFRVTTGTHHLLRCNVGRLSLLAHQRLGGCLQHLGLDIHQGLRGTSKSLTLFALRSHGRQSGKRLIVGAPQGLWHNLEQLKLDAFRWYNSCKRNEDEDVTFLYDRQSSPLMR